MVDDERPVLQFDSLQVRAGRTDSPEWLILCRARIPGGWLVGSPGARAGPPAGLAFVPDPEHLWDGGSVDVKAGRPVEAAAGCSAYTAGKVSAEGPAILTVAGACDGTTAGLAARRTRGVAVARSAMNPIYPIGESSPPPRRNSSARAGVRGLRSDRHLFSRPAPNDSGFSPAASGNIPES